MFCLLLIGIAAATQQRQQQYKTAEGRAKLAYEEGDTHHGGCGHCGGDE